MPSQSASIRAAKKSARPTKIGIPLPAAPKVKNKAVGGGKKRSAFDEREKKGGGGAAAGGHEGMRSKQVKVSLSKGKGGKSGGAKGKGAKGKPKGKR